LPSENIRQDLIGYPEAERFSGFSRRTLRRLIGNGQLRAAKIGRAMRIDKHSLEKYMHDHDYAEQLRLFD
jgi:excisionase family DNA binding protein